MTCWFYEKGKKFGRLQMSPYSTLEFDPVLETSYWIKRISFMHALVDLYCLSCSGTGLSLAAELPWPFLGIVFLADSIQFVPPVGSVNRLFLASVGLAVVIVCIILRPVIEWSWPCLIFIFNRPVCIIKFRITRRLRARTAGCSTPPRRCRRCPAPAPPRGQATRAVTASCVGFAGLWTPAIWGT